MFGGISIWQLLILLVIVVLIFGTRRLGSMGSDVGEAIKNFRSAMSDGDSNKPTTKTPEVLPGSTPTASGAPVEPSRDKSRPG
jgi:sec-independent protein translocase protein TatA